MKIKYFFLLLNFLLVIIITVFFSYFFYIQKKHFQDLIIKNVKNELINLKYIFTKVLNFKNNYILLKPILDRKIVSTPVIKGFIVTKNGKILLKSGYIHLKLPENKDKIKFNIKNFSFEDLSQKNILYLPIEYYVGNKKEKIILYTFIDKKMIYNRLFVYKMKFIVFYILMIAVFLGLSVILIKRFVTSPLEELKLFAERKLKQPKKFFITEFEDIKIALNHTFKKLEQNLNILYKNSITDSLTSLANRNKLEKFVKKLIKNMDSEFALIYLDLDNFKEINDIYGHSTGDAVLVKISSVLKKYTNKNELSSRLGGDEFVLVWKNYKDKKDLESRLINLLNEIAKDLIINNMRVKLSASTGVSIFPYHAKNYEDLLKYADIALRKAKETKNKVVFFDKSLFKNLEKEMNIKNELPRALRNNEFVLFFQPKVDKNKKVVSCEALIRWIKPDGTIIPPYEFIPVAEKSGFIYEIGNWVIKEVFKTNIKWQNDKILKNISIAFNISPMQIKNDSFLKDFEAFIYEFHQDTKKIEAEITETVLIENKKMTMEIINKFHKKNIKIDLDDFGTGYSSIAFLKDFDVDIIKIDKTFVDDIENEKDKIYVKAIVDMAKALKKELVAEGIENEIQFNILKGMGVDYFQGYFFAKPMKEEDFINYVKKVNV